LTNVRGEDGGSGRNLV